MSKRNKQENVAREKEKLCTNSGAALTTEYVKRAVFMKRKAVLKTKVQRGKRKTDGASFQSKKTKGRHRIEEEEGKTSR